MTQRASFPQDGRRSFINARQYDQHRNTPRL